MIPESTSSALCDVPADQGNLEIGYPRLHVSQDETVLTLYIDLVGTREEDLSVHIEGRQLVIDGRTRCGEDIHEPDYFGDVAAHSYRRTFLLPVGIDRSGIKTQFHNGSLTVACPRSA